MRRALLIAVLASLVSITGFASQQATQSKTGIIRGIVRDPSEALVPGAKITLSSLEKTDVKTAVSGSRGEFSVEAPAGTYELKAELRGFKPSIARPLRLNESEAIRMIMILGIDVPGQPPSPPPVRQ